MALNFIDFGQGDYHVKIIKLEKNCFNLNLVKVYSKYLNRLIHIVNAHSIVPSAVIDGLKDAVCYKMLLVSRRIYRFHNRINLPEEVIQQSSFNSYGTR